MYNTLRRMYMNGVIDELALYNAVRKGYITNDDVEKIKLQTKEIRKKSGVS